MLELVDAGASHLVLAPIAPWPSAPAHWLAEEIVEPVIAELAAGGWLHIDGIPGSGTIVEFWIPNVALSEGASDGPQRRG